MQTELLRLRAPYGKGSGDSISLRCDGPVHFGIFEILEGYGCPRFVADRAAQCLNHSGRYDCEVTSHMFREVGDELQRELGEIGVRLVVQRLTPKNPKPVPRGFMWIEE